MTKVRSRTLRWLTLAAFVLALFAMGLFGFGAYRSLLLLHSAYEVGIPDLANIRPWMTLGYVARTYGVEELALVDRLGLPRSTDPESSVMTLAERDGVSAFEYTQSVQRAIADVEASVGIEREEESSSWLDAVGDDLLAAVSGGGYAVLGFILLLGAIGLPLPTGLATIVAGSVSAHGEMKWPLAAAIACGASVTGDIVGYTLGRLLSRAFLERHGWWLGYTRRRQDRVEELLHRWGGVTVFLSRTLMSHMSSAVNLLVGAGRYRLYRFFLFTVVGRLIWTGAYLGLGYIVGTDLDAAAGFLTQLSVFLALGAVLLGLALAVRRQNAASPQTAP